MSANKQSLRWLWFSVFIIILDQLTKYLSVAYLTKATPMKLLPIFNLSLAYNRGSAFGFLNQPGSWQVYLFAAIAVAVIIFLLVWLARTPAMMRLRACGIAFIIGGAVGNLIDRVRLHAVIDFLQFHVSDWYFPTFNVADTAVTLGAICLIISLLIDE